MAISELELNKPQPASEELGEVLPKMEPNEKLAPQGKSRRKRKSKSWQRTLTLLRRIHLYSGIVMFPWVMLYGFTAMLFNHPATLPDAKVVSTNLSSEQGDSLLAEEFAAALLDQLNDSPDGVSAEVDPPARIRLATPARASFTGRSSWSLESEGQRHLVVMNLNNMAGYVKSDEVESDKESTSSADDKDQDWSAGGKREVTLDTEPLVGIMKNALASAQIEIAEEDLTADAIRIPTLEFDVEVDGERKRVRYQIASNRGRGQAQNASTKSRNSDGDDKLKSTDSRLVSMKTPRNGELQTVDSIEPRELSWRRYLLRLHTAHGYSAEKNARWYWAIVVDIMFVSMCFWGLSGMLMWWQLKKTRLLGIILVLVSFGLAFWLAVSMHAEMVS